GEGGEPEGLLGGDVPPGNRPVGVVHAVRFPVEVVVQRVPTRGEEGGGHGREPHGEEAGEEASGLGCHEGGDSDPRRGHRRVSRSGQEEIAPHPGRCIPLRIKRVPRELEGREGHISATCSTRVAAFSRSILGARSVRARDAFYILGGPYSLQRLYGPTRSLSTLALAGRAETLASSLEERYRSAQKVLNALLAISKKAREVGFQSAELDGAIAEARRVAREGTVENGVSIPNYLQARTLLESATTRG